MFEMDGDGEGPVPTPSGNDPVGQAGDMDGSVGSIGMGVMGSKVGERGDGVAISPSESMSSTDSDVGAGQVGVKPGVGGRRMSNVSDEERERARVYREGVMNKGGE